MSVGLYFVASRRNFAPPAYLRVDATLSLSAQAIDMWSMGVIFYTLLGGYHPFHDERQPRLFRRIRDGSFVFHDELWDSTSDQAKVRVVLATGLGCQCDEVINAKRRHGILDGYFRHRY